ncbi:hypothetical protein ACJIZ3_018967 [Penstemon smallii]|uniref:UspA domain-containing protein n=1 Tax=Penstemon smallii TaxID=265156 RepID=A0ABD3SZW4_9LAMI
MEITGATADTSAGRPEGAEERQPLMAAAEERKNSKMKVLVPIDESDGSFYALKWALDHIVSNSASGNSEPHDQDPNTITLLHVHPFFQPFIYPAGPAVYATPSVIEAVKKGREESAAAILSRALHICKQKKIKAETLILEGDPKDKICEAAEQLHVDLVVIGSRGLGAIKRKKLVMTPVKLYPGYATDCAHHVHCPVLIVKPPTKLAHE